MTFPSRCIAAASALVAASLFATVADAQRGVVQITSAVEVHQEAKISPDGQTIAFRGPSKIGVVTFAGVGEAPLVSSSSLGGFLWAPNSSGLYYLDGSDLKFIARSGGSATLLRSLTGQRVQLWAVDHTDSVLFGTRYDPATQASSIWSIPTTGGVAATDIVTSQDTFDQIQVDPSDSRIVYRQYGSAPFSPIEIFSADLSGKNISSLTGGTVTSSPEYPEWVDAGQSIAFTVQSPNTNRKQVGRIGPASTQIVLLTDGVEAKRLTAVSRNYAWVLMQAQIPTGYSPAILPTAGGGLILFGEPGHTYALQGQPSMDANGNRMVFAASLDGAPAQVFGVTLQRELRITPRAETGNSFGITLPVASGEAGAVLLAGGFTTNPLAIPGIAGNFELDPTILLTVVSGSSATGALMATIPVPNNPWLIGQQLYLQGARITGLGGDLTSRVYVPIF